MGPSAWFDAFKYAKSKNQADTVHSLRRVVLNGTLRAIEQGSYELATDEEPVPMDLNRDLVTQSVAEAKLYPADHAWVKPRGDSQGHRPLSCRATASTWRPGSRTAA